MSKYKQLILENLNIQQIIINIECS